MGALRLGPAALALVALVAPAPASAQSVDAALELFYEARFAEAAAELDAVLASPTLELEAAVEAHRYRAALHLLADDEVAARRHARAAVALDPAVRAPEGVSRAESVFEAARASLPDAPTRLLVRAREEGGERVVEAAAEPFVTALFDRVVLACGDRDERGPGPRVELRLPLDASPRCDARAETTGGATLLRGDLTVTGPDGAGGLDDATLYAILGGAGGALLLAIVITAVALAAAPQGVGFELESGPWD